MSQDFNDFFEEQSTWVGGSSAPTPSAVPPAPPRSRKEMRKRRKARRNRRRRVIALIIVLVLILGAGGYLGAKKLRSWTTSFSSSSVEDYTGPGTGSATITITNGEGAAQVAQSLLDTGVIKSTEAFTSYVAANNVTLYPGTYTLKQQMKASDAAKYLANQNNAQGFVEVRAGETVNEVIENAVASTDLTKADFEKVINDKGKGILPDCANGSFEGWLEPGTYDAHDQTASDVLKAMVDARIKKLDELGVPSGSDREKVLIIASIAEAEVNKSDYYGKVSRVILNRLDQGMTLGMDTTVAYGLGIKASQLTNAQLQDASNPYNTRVNKGLPPTPISNPGDNAIEAALHPEDGNWLYFVTTNLQTGETKFTDNADTFEQYVQEYKTNNPDAN